MKVKLSNYLLMAVLQAMLAVCGGGYKWKNDNYKKKIIFVYMREN